MKFFIFLVLAIILGLIIKPLTAPGFFPIHDDTQVVRVYEMTKALKDGVFPARWSQDLGYGFGYPIFNFYDPLPYYTGGVFGIIGFDSLSSTKLIVILGIIVSAVSMFILAKEFWGLAGGLLSSSLYVLAVYHAVDIFVRGDFAEATAFSLMPFVFYGLWKINKEKKYKYVLITSVSYALIIISHNLTALMISPFIILFIVYLLFNSKDAKKDSIRFFSALILGLLLSSFYWVPALFELKYTNVLAQIGGGADFKDHFVCPLQLWSSPWGYGGSAKGCNDGLSFMIGKINIFLSLAAFALALFFLFKKKFLKLFEKNNLRIILISYIGFLLSVFFTLAISKPVWDLIPVMAFLQYPWRFLILIVFFSSFISGSLIWLIEKLFEKRLSYSACILLVGILVLINVKYFNPQFILNKNSNDYTNTYSLKWTASKTSDEYMPKGFDKPRIYNETSDLAKFNSSKLKVISFHQTTQKIKLNLNIVSSGSFVLPIAYFPSWAAYLDGKRIEIKEESRGISADLPKGSHVLVLSFDQTPVEIFSDLLSLTAILFLLGYNLRKHG